MFALCVYVDSSSLTVFCPVDRYPGSAAPVSVRRASSECSPVDGVRHEGDRGALCDKIFRRIVEVALIPSQQFTEAARKNARWARCNSRMRPGASGLPPRSIHGEEGRV